MHEIIIPQVNFEDDSLEECLDFLALKMRELESESYGISVWGEAHQKIHFTRKNISIHDLVDELCKQSGLSWSFGDDLRILIRPKRTKDPAHSPKVK